MSSKRLRGWSLQKETFVQDTPSSLASSSKLASKLLCLWAHGTLSATLIQELAHLAILDGAEHHELAALAKAGKYGEVKGNNHRDLMATFCKGIQFESFEITAPCLDPKAGQVQSVETAVFLPHVSFYTLAKEYPEKFAAMFSIQHLQDFWEAASNTGDDRIRQHPMTSGQGWKKKVVPLFLHGDGVEYQNRDTLMVWSFGSLLSLFGSLDSHLLMALFPKSCTTAGTWDPIWKWLAWSFQALLSGKHPELDPDGKPLEKGSPFYENRGQPLTAQGLKAVIWSIQGDHDFFSNVLGLPHWRNAKPCWECDCTNDDSNPEKSFRTIRPSLQRFHLLDQKEALEKAVSKHPVFGIPGVSSRIVRGDGLHILFTKGIYAHLLGSILHYLCWKEGPGAQVVQPCKRLALIFEQIQYHYKNQEAATRLTNLKMSMFTNLARPHSQHAFLSAKGAECKHLGPALLEVCKAALDPNNEVDNHIVMALEGITNLVALFDACSMFLSDAEYAEALVHAEQFLNHYDSLNKWALEKGRLLFHVVIKFHTFWHLVVNAKHLNPRFHWCFKSEDFVGKMSKLGFSVSMGTRTTKLSQKIAAKYIILMHLRLTRDGFGHFAEDI